MVASYGMVEGIYQLIDHEIAEARAGRKAKMVLKMNSLEEQGVIEKLYEASEGGCADRPLGEGHLSGDTQSTF